MTPENSSQQQSANIKTVIKRVNKIKNLESEVINLKRQLLFESSIIDIEQNDENEPNFLLLKSSGKLLAAPLNYVDEVIEIPELMKLPKPAPSIAGMLNYHGELLAVIDVNTIGSNKQSLISSLQMLVICTVDNRRFALLVDEALEVVTVSSDQITMSDNVLPGLIQSSGLLNIEESEPALIIDIVWIAVGTHLGAVLNNDMATPAIPVEKP